MSTQISYIKLDEMFVFIVWLIDPIYEGEVKSNISSFIDINIFLLSTYKKFILSCTRGGFVCQRKSFFEIVLTYRGVLVHTSKELPSNVEKSSFQCVRVIFGGFGCSTLLL